MTRQERLADAHLYFVGDEAMLARALDGALRGGVDIVQLRSPGVPVATLRAAAIAIAQRCRAAGALFVVNDDPQLALESDADGVHVGQDDVAVARAREILGPDRLVGLSTHSTEQIDSADGSDYIGVGAVWATPTKPDAQAVGLELVRYAAGHAKVPFFAIGGIDAANAPAVCAAGATRIAVVRAIGDAADPETAARTLLEATRRADA